MIEVLGVRAPGLKPGYNTQYEVLIDYGFIWDSSLGVAPLETPVWPYTLDYKIPHKCIGNRWFKTHLMFVSVHGFMDFFSGSVPPGHFLESGSFPSTRS